VLIPILHLKGWRLREGVDRAARQRRRRALGLDPRTPQGRLVGGACALEQARLSTKRYVYVRVDGIHVQARLEDAAQGLLVIIGATPEGKKELVGLIDGVRESAQSWRELLLDLKRRRDLRQRRVRRRRRALGFWQAIEEVWPKTRGQRCWAHKTANRPEQPPG